MRVEPPVDRAALLQRIHALYGLPALELTFVPLGECSVAYVLHCAGGREYFLKLWPDSRQGRFLRERLAWILPVTRELHERGLFPNLPAPIPSISGALLEDFAGYALALFIYIQGRPLEHADQPHAALAQIARSMASLHRATDQMRSPLPPGAPFAVGFGEDLRRGLRILAEPRPDCTPGQAHLRGLLLPRRDALLAEMDAIERLRAQAEARAHALVLCHTDMGGSNVLVDAAGQVYVLDWDDLILAPPEQDLAEYRGPGFEHFLEIYFLAGGVRGLDPLQFAFYLKRRYLGDLVDWLMRILEEDNGPLQDASDLEGITTYCLPWLDGFEKEMAEIQRALKI